MKALHALTLAACLACSTAANALNVAPSQPHAPIFSDASGTLFIPYLEYTTPFGFMPMRLELQTRFSTDGRIFFELIDFGLTGE